jgi:pentatricopeptide repeat protein
MSHPESLTKPEMEALQQIVQEFPYFGAAQTLLSRAYLNEHDYRFTDQVSHAAFYSGNRLGLYRLLHPTDQQSAVLESTAESTVAPIEITVVEEQPVEVEVNPELSALASRMVDEEENVTESPIKETLDAPEAPAPKEAYLEIELKEEESNAEPAELTEVNPLQEQILLGAIADSIALEVQPTHDQELPEQSVTPKTEFGAWLKQRSQLTGFTSPTAKNQKEAEEEDNLEAFYQSATARGQQRPIQHEQEEGKQRKLIDRFIQFEPKIERGRAAEFPQANLAKESLEEDPELVTETMAQLFARQGKFDKARKVYRKLMEQFPEKSVYFAAQLKSIEKFKK